MYKKEFLYILVLMILFVCPVISADDSEKENAPEEKNEKAVEKKRFLPWLLDDFKITKRDAYFFITKEKADYYNLYGPGPDDIMINDEKFTLSLYPNGSRRRIQFMRTTKETKNSQERLFIFTIAERDNRCLRMDDGEIILEKLLMEFPSPLIVSEFYAQEYWYKEQIENYRKSTTQIKIVEIWYVFSVKKAEMERFMSLVPKDQFTAEVYDGFVVLHRIYSKEEAEKRKDFLLNTNGQSKGLWNLVKPYDGPPREYHKPYRVRL